MMSEMRQKVSYEVGLEINSIICCEVECLCLEVNDNWLEKQADFLTV